MANFMFVYRNAPEAMSKMSPEEMQLQMHKWQTWIAEGFKNGWMVNPGDALKQTGCVVNSKKVVIDGPFVEAKEIVGGFSLVTADSLEAAAEIAKGCPGLATGGNVEIRQLEGFTAK